MFLEQHQKEADCEKHNASGRSRSVGDRAPCFRYACQLDGPRRIDRLTKRVCIRDHFVRGARAILAGKTLLCDTRGGAVLVNMAAIIGSVSRYDAPALRQFGGRFAISEFFVWSSSARTLGSMLSCYVMRTRRPLVIGLRHFESGPVCAK